MATSNTRLQKSPRQSKFSQQYVNIKITNFQNFKAVFFRETIRPIVDQYASLLEKFLLEKGPNSFFNGDNVSIFHYVVLFDTL